MKSIKAPITDEFEVKNSRFITYLIPLDTVDNAKNELMTIKQKHPDANHHCSAYIIGDNQEIQKADDDGEPSQTAGVPILDVFKKNEITNVLCVVVRYFGGVKLGAGGLIRAYSKGASEALKKATLTQKQKYDYLEIRGSFDSIGILEHLIGEHATLLSRDYGEDVIFNVSILSRDRESFEARLIESTQNKVSINIIKSVEYYQ